MDREMGRMDMKIISDAIEFRALKVDGGHTHPRHCFLLNVHQVGSRISQIFVFANVHQFGSRIKTRITRGLFKVDLRGEICQVWSTREHIVDT